MKVGIVLNISSELRRTDAQVLMDHLAVAQTVEGLGFDGVFVLEHHFSGYVLSPAPFELLSYLAARTNTIDLCTAVVVLPWHDPIRVAEQVAILDILSNGRCLFGFGRGRSVPEYEAFRVPISESRVRFREAAEIITGLLREDHFSYRGSIFTIPELSLRPRPFSRPYERFFGAASGEISIKTMAELDFGLMMSTQKSWDILGNDAALYRNAVDRMGREVKKPIVLSTISVGKTHRGAYRAAYGGMYSEWKRIDDHYRFSQVELGTIPDYEEYNDLKSYFTAIQKTRFAEVETHRNLDMQICGTPEICYDQILQLAETTGLGYLALEFQYGNISMKKAIDDMGYFAKEVLPHLKKLKDNHA